MQSAGYSAMSTLVLPQLRFKYDNGHRLTLKVVRNAFLL